MTDLPLPSKAIGYIQRIVVMALAIALLGLSVVVVIVAIDGHRTQTNADILTRRVDELLTDNEELKAELQCLRPAAFDYDEASAAIQLDIARGLAIVTTGAALPPQFGQNIGVHALKLEQSIESRRESLTKCSKP